MARIPKKDLPAYVRRCWDAWIKANIHVREAEKERLKFYVGGDLQWRDAELTKRKNSRRPWVTINKCKPAVDQIEGDIRLNPPGPECHPVGDGADGDTADIYEGLIREVEYRSGAKVAYSTAAKYAAASGFGVIELASEFVDERSFAQQLVIQSIEDPQMVFFDPASRKANREDAGWAGKLKMYSRSEYIAAFGDKRRVLQTRAMQSAMGWIQEAMGVGGDLAQINEWTGTGQGPFFVAEFYMVEAEQTELQLYSDGISRFKDEPAPEGVLPKEGEEFKRKVSPRKITKHVVDALEELEETEWLGDIIPLFPVLGPEIYIDGKLHRLSLIAGAIDSQRALNYVASTATELAGAMPKSPWLGAKGQFDDPKWQTANSEMWAYLEYTPVFVVEESTGAQQLAPAPQRNQWEAPIQWLLALGAYFSDAIKAVTAIYDPSLGAQKGEQSGVAIQQLRSESNVGNYSYADNLHRAIEIMYQQMVNIFPKLLDGPRVVTIVKPDSQHEIVEINREFPDGIDPATGKKGKAKNIGQGRFAMRCMAGPDFQTRQLEAVKLLLEFFKTNPQALGAPGVAAKFLRMLGEGNPEVEAMADLLSPQQDGDATPQQLGQQLQAEQQKTKALTMVVQKMQESIASKLPEIEAKKWIAALNAIAGIREAEIKAGSDKAQADLDTFESILGMAHERGMQAVEHKHAEGMQDSQQQAAQAQQMQQQQHESEQQPTGVE